jgi:hypothetical protein
MTWAAKVAQASALRCDGDSCGGLARVGQRDGDLPLTGGLGGTTVQENPRRLAGFDLDLAGRNALPEGFDHGLLRGKARRQVASRPRAAARVGELCRGEKPIGETWAALERSLDALDLDQVDADAYRHDAGLN